MIPRKRLQLLLYVLRIFYVVSESDANDLVETGESVDLEETSSLDYAEYTTTMNLSDLDPSKSIVELPDKTEESVTNEFVTYDYTQDDDIVQSSTNPSFNNFTQDTTITENSTMELDDEVFLNVTEEEISKCERLWQNGMEELADVQNLTVNSNGTTWISLSWHFPCSDSENVTLFIYSIKMCTTEKCTETYENRTQYNATDLKPCTQYNFTVKVINGNRTSNGVSLLTHTDHKIDAIGNVQNLNVYSANTTTIELKWSLPAIHPTCVLYYSVSQCLKDGCSRTVVNTTKYPAKNLEPCKEYFFTVVTFAKELYSAGVNISGKTKSPELSEPQFPEVQPGNFSLHVRWQPPQLGASCIKHYHVTVGNVTTETLTGTNITITGLQACTGYNIYINAVNQDNNDGGTVTIQEETLPVVTKSPTLDNTEPVVTMNSVWFSWNIEKDNNNCPLTSVVTICNYTTTNGRGFIPMNGETETMVESRITENSLTVNTTVENINPYTTYTCWAYTINKAGFSEFSDPVNVTTLEDVPSEPPLQVSNITDTQFVFTWDYPKYLAGNLEDFEISLTWEPLFVVPDWCSVEPKAINISTNGSILLYEYTEAKPFTRYTARIRAKTAAGWGNYSKPLIFQSKPGVSEMVSDFTYAIQENEYDRNVLDTILTWSLPCSLNGIIEYFNVSVYGTRNGHAAHPFSLAKNVTGGVYRNDRFSINLGELKGEYNYTFNVSVKIATVNENGVEASINNVLYPAGIPPPPDEKYIKSITIDPYKSRRTTTSATILLPLFPDTNGDILYYSIIISEEGYNIASTTRFNLKENSWPNVSSWEESMLKDFTIPYQATRPQWDPYPNYVADYGHMRAVKYVLGEDTHCKEISSNIDKRLYCNGPLKPDTWYQVRMRAFTYGGYTDSEAFLIKTNAELNVGIVIGIVLGILLLGILTTMMLLVGKCSPQAVLRRFLHSDMSGSPVPAPFARKKFIAHCQQLVDNPGKLSNEFRLLQTLSVDLQMPTNTACLQANKKKNRYSDILPYDFSRVKLEVIDNDPNTDYINASFIRGYTGDDEYIACQGPKEETTYDFWRMVDQYNINIIVMLTQLVEKGKEKCHQYFPTIGETFRYENMTIRCTSELDFRTYTQRTLVLQKGNKKRSIMHLHFKDWPDHDVPEDFDAMINFCQIMRRSIMANKGYVIIHCSAGIGRTGTLIAIDILLQHLRDNKKLDVFGTVYRLRHNRINMVQRESQYAYIYNCIKQVLKNPYCLKTYKPPPVDPVYENVPKKGKTPNSNTNLVNNLETLKKRRFFISMDSIGPLYDIFSWPSRKPRANAMNNGLRYCKSVDAIDKKTRRSSLGDSDSLDCLIYEILQSETNDLDKDNSNKIPLKGFSNSIYENLQE